MLFGYMLLIMGAAGVLGGLVNFLLPDNNPSASQYVRAWWKCIILGIGATFLVPLFLEIAQSRLLGDVVFSTDDNIAKPAAAQPGPVVGAASVATAASKSASDSTRRVDSTRKANAARKGDSARKADSVSKANAAKVDSAKAAAKPHTRSDQQDSPGKEYLLWAAYCLLAAAAGYKFINLIINDVVNNTKLAEMKAENQKLRQSVEMRAKNNAMAQAQTHSEVNPSMPFPIAFRASNPDDPQKGQFGGSPQNNDRSLSATIAPHIKGYFTLTLRVVSTDAAKPLTGDVVFYLHDSIHKSVQKVQVDGGGVARLIKIVSAGAFTVGATADGGATVLELDLAKDKSLPKAFREG